MTPDRVRAARALLGWSLGTLGRRSGVGPGAVRTYEQTGRLPLARIANRGVDRLAAIRAAMEAASVEFIEQKAAILGCG